MFFVVLIIPICLVFLEKSLRKYLPILFSTIAILIWGFYGLYKTDRFAILKSSSSINSFVMSYALNENFHNYYPNKSTDLIPVEDSLKYNFQSEWEFYDFYKEKNDIYLSENLNRYIKDIFIKVKFILFGIIWRDGALPDQYGNFDNRLEYLS